MKYKKEDIEEILKDEEIVFKLPIYYSLITKLGKEDTEHLRIVTSSFHQTTKYVVSKFYKPISKI